MDEFTSHLFRVCMQFRLQRDEYLTSVEGHYSHFNGNVVIRSLNFVTNLRTHGPYGNACGVVFQVCTLDVPLQQIVAAYHHSYKISLTRTIGHVRTVCGRPCRVLDLHEETKGEKRRFDRYFFS